MEKRYNGVWDALYGNSNVSIDFKKRADYLILIEARLYGQSGTETEKADRFGLSIAQMRDLFAGKIDKFSLAELVAIARRIGVTAKV